MPAIPTRQVRYRNGALVLINAADFDPELHADPADGAVHPDPPEPEVAPEPEPAPKPTPHARGRR